MRIRAWTPVVRFAAGILAAWAALALAMFVWVLVDDDLRDSQQHAGFFMLASLFLVAACFCLAVAQTFPGWGSLGAGLVLLAIGVDAAVFTALGLRDWGEPATDPRLLRHAWDPFDSLSPAPFVLAAVMGIVVAVGGVVELLDRRRRTQSGAPRVDPSARDRLV